MMEQTRAQTERAGVAREAGAADAVNWAVGDWVVYGLRIGQIKELRGNGCAAFTDGFCETSGHLVDRFRRLTLRNKRIVETFDTYYMRLREIDGEAGFNYPDISRYFERLTLDAIDNPDAENGCYELAQQFVQSARDYKPVIDGVSLFRRNLRIVRP